jgi:twinkle protein
MSTEILQIANNLGIGQHKIACPECQDSRTKHKRDRPLSVRVDGKGVQYRCHHCDAEGGWINQAERTNTWGNFPPKAREQEVRTIKPIVIRENETNQKALDYLKSRSIADEIIDKHTILSTYRFNGKTVPAVGFPYRDGKDVTAVKWRSADKQKNFSQENVCEDFFNLDSYVDGNDILICEGELDALAWMSCDLPENLTVLSIPNGAPAGVKDGKIDPKDDNKFRYIWRAERQLKLCSKIILNTDDDAPGKALEKEIIRRVGSSKTWLVSLDEYKDASEALEAEGQRYLENQLDKAKVLPIIGVNTVDDIFDSVVDLYEQGQIKGASTGLTALDEYMQVPLGMLTIVTGFPASGKSDLVDQLCVNLARSNNWKTVFCSFEKPADYHYAQLSQKIIDRPFFIENEASRMSPEEVEFSREVMKENFVFMDNRSGGASDIDSILRKASECVLRYGSRILVIDPYNYIDMGGGRETDAISQMLTKIQQWAKNHDAHVFFVAHPAKLSNERRSGKKVVVTGLDISGSHTWFSKADIGLTVWRHPKDEEPPEAHVWKARWNWVGKNGSCPLHYDKFSGRWQNYGPAFDDYDWDFE